MMKKRIYEECTTLVSYNLFQRRYFPLSRLYFLLILPRQAFLVLKFNSISGQKMSQFHRRIQYFARHAFQHRYFPLSQPHFLLLSPRQIKQAFLILTFKYTSCQKIPQFVQRL